MATKLCYRDLSHPSFQETIKSHNYTTLKLVKTVAEFAQKISLAHEQFANQVLNVVESYKKKYQELRKERGPTGAEEDDRQSVRSSRASLRNRRRSSRKNRPMDCASSLNNAWETLLQETQYDAQAHADTATLIMKNVYTPLLEVASYKKSQAKKLYQFRENFDSILNNAEENVYKCHKAYIEAYQNYRKNSNGRDSMMYMAQYHNAHNEYVLQIRASNDQQHEYHNEALPYLLEELEEIHIDLANTLNGAIESHALLLLTKVNANEQSRRFEGILKICKQVNPKLDIHNFILSVSQEPVPFEPKLFSFQPPSDPNIPGSELGTLKEQIVFDRSTEPAIKARRLELQKEASELTSYLKQNQDITHTLMNVCQRNLANHLYAKVYETQEDLCRKRNEIRIANLQLAAIRAQIELLSPKQNGSTVDGGDGAHSSNKQSIKGMWKKAFRSLKVKDKEKDTAKAANEETSSRYSRQLRQQQSVTEDMSSRQSSLKRVLRRKVSEEVSDQEPVPEEDPANMDPVFAHLKQAADARKRCLSTGSSFDASMDEVGLGLDFASQPFPDTIKE